MDIFTKFKSAVKIREIQIDNHVSQLHYRVTTIMLAACGLLVASKQHFGDPIDCMSRDDVPLKILDSYCWIHSTFTLPRACNRTIGTDIPHPCVDSSREEDERVYHKYYQWVYFVLFFQAATFYAPHLCWKACESKLLSYLTKDLNKPVSKDNKKNVQKIVEYMSRHKNMHKDYFYYFVGCEVFNFFNVLLQVIIVDQFLGGTFTTFGLDALSYWWMEQEERVDPLIRVFPRMTKCGFQRFGASGEVMKYDALCILPLNIINEKIYIIMWFWFVFLGFVTFIWLIYRALTFCKSNVRYERLRRRVNPFTDGELVRSVFDTLDIGDWFLLSMICKNIHPTNFRMLLRRLDHEYTRKKLKEAKSSAAKHEPQVRLEMPPDTDDEEKKSDNELEDDETKSFAAIEAAK